MITCTALRWGAPGQPLTPALDLTLEKGSLTGIIGANGTGKSSLLKVIAGLQKPLAGKVSVEVPRRGGLSFLPQQQHLDRQFPISLQELVAAGFPCQDLSQAGRTAGITGTRSGLVAEVFRLVRRRRGCSIKLCRVPGCVQTRLTGLSGSWPSSSPIRQRRYPLDGGK